MLHAKDIVVSTNNKTPLDIFVGSQSLLSGVGVQPVILSNTAGSATNNSAAGEEYITYTPLTGFVGVDTFEYSLTVGTQIAFGTIRVLVHECCGDTSGLPDMVPPPPRIYYVSADTAYQHSQDQRDV